MSVTDRLSGSELRTLCFDLDLEYDDLPGQGKIDKAREIIIYLEHRNNIKSLLEYIEKNRSDIDIRSLDRTTLMRKHFRSHQNSIVISTLSILIVIVFISYILYSTSVDLPWSSSGLCESMQLGATIEKFYDTHIPVRIQKELGCPIEEEIPGWASEQSFEIGFMGWRDHKLEKRPENRKDTIYVFFGIDGGSYRAIDQGAYLQFPEPTSIPEISNSPHGGFGRVYIHYVDPEMADTSTVERLGLWVGSTRENRTAAFQKFENGNIFLIRNQLDISEPTIIYVLHTNGRFSRHVVYNL